MKKIIISVFKKYKWLFLLEILLIIANIKLNTYPAKMTGQIIDLFYNVDENRNLIIQNIMFILMSSAGVILLKTSWKYIEVQFSTEYTKTLRIELYKKLMRVHLEELNNIKNGEIMSYFVSDIKAMNRIVTKIVSTITRTIMTLIIVIGAMIKDTNLKLTLAIMVPIIFTTIITIILKNYVEKAFKKAQESFTKLSEYVQESTDSIRTTKAYAGEEKKVNEFYKKNIKVKEDNNKLELYASLLNITITISFGLCYAITILYGSNLALKGEITTGNIVAITRIYNIVNKSNDSNSMDN